MSDELRRPDDEALQARDARDTEGHRIGPLANAEGILPDRRIGPGEKLLRGDGTPVDLHDQDTEGHLLARRSSHGGE